MKKGLRIAAAAAVFLFALSIGSDGIFAVTQGAEPGSDQDPIVSKSYVDAAAAQLNAGIQKLQEQIDALKNENARLSAKLSAQEQANAALQNELKALKADIASGKLTPAGSGNTGTKTSTGGKNNSGGTGNAGAPGNSGNTGNTGNTGTKPPSSIGKATVNTAVLNIRKQPNTTSAIVAKVLMGETLTLVEKTGGWYKVTTSKGIAGYVLGSLIKINK